MSDNKLSIYFHKKTTFKILKKCTIRIYSNAKTHKTALVYSNKTLVKCKSCYIFLKRNRQKQHYVFLQDRGGQMRLERRLDKQTNGQMNNWDLKEGWTNEQRDIWTNRREDETQEPPVDQFAPHKQSGVWLHFLARFIISHRSWT